MKTSSSFLTFLLAALPGTLCATDGEQPAMHIQGKDTKHVPTTIVTNWKWRDPFDDDGGPPDGFTATCESKATFFAKQYTLRDHMTPPPHGFLPWAEALKPLFGGKPFPGGWGGLDAHGTLRTVLIMEYADVPAAVKDWIEQEGEKGLFGVYDKPSESVKSVNTTAAPRKSKGDKGEEQIMIFAAGALYEILPLWVAEGSGCKDELLDLDRYKVAPGDGAVVAWPVDHTMPDRRRDKREMEFTIKAQILKRLPEGAAKLNFEAKDHSQSAFEKQEL